MKRTESPSGRIIKTVLIDLLVLGAFLLTFAYFHHVRVREPAPVSIAAPTPTAAPTPVAPAASTDAGDVTAAPTAENDLLGGRFAEKFTAGEVEATERSYRSANVSLTVDTVSENDVTYHVADIYIRDITSFRTAVAFEYEAYNTGVRKNAMPTLQMATLSGAITAISGDNYSFRKEGLIAVRNGVEWEYNLPIVQDLCALFYDGTMEVFTQKSMNRAGVEALYARNPYQVWSFGPLLVNDGQIGTAFRHDKRNPLSAVGYYEPGHYCFILVDGRQKGYSLGMTLEELANVFLGLGCKVAYNLDGGDTAVMTFGEQWLSRPENGEPREVSDILYIAEPLPNGGDVA